ncbi:MAG: tRNA uridine-5-carboxymethylaminomethyl(34) synthesis GTPase MnmE [Bacteroidales bacterium]|nr:tRNA uridine-5-carboxymethylaminomethyl(34) synthesis GTPase MnmE [Clostridium sp.]MCM1204280.1 tRNA uridine-5-carboxymethylaminomethyl(34) synthesis GTPase MnmE [Bacteroidales bacterium]
MIKLSDTIAAVATGMNQGGIGVIRISGKDAVKVADSVFTPKKKGKEIRNLSSYTAAYGNIKDSETLVDEVIVLVMKAPYTYTREDVVEIDCHGGAQVMEQILHLLLKNGARLAEPGEFTKRAFLNGRIDLSQAESVMDLISAKSDLAAKTALSQLKGNLKEKVQKMRQQLIHHIAYIESALDDSENYSLDGFSEALDDFLTQLEEETVHLIETAEDGKIMKEGIRTVISGKPNAGKSSVLNVLMGKERAIVTEIAGTTRDTLEEFISINGIPLNIVDTAGIRNTEDIVEKIGVDKSVEAMEEADLILFVVDTSVPLDENDIRIMEKIKDKQVIVLQNKSDLKNVVTAEEIKKYLEKPLVDISAKEKTGFEEFYQLLKNMFFHGSLSYNDEVYITNLRHKEALEKSLEGIRLVRRSIAEGMPEDFYSIDLMEAYERLGDIIGESVEDDLVDTIFREFCMGK